MNLPGKQRPVQSRRDKALAAGPQGQHSKTQARPASRSPPPLPQPWKSPPKPQAPGPSPMSLRSASLRLLHSHFHQHRALILPLHPIPSRHPRSPKGRHTDKKRSVPIGPGQARTRPGRIPGRACSWTSRRTHQHTLRNLDLPPLCSPLLNCSSICLPSPSLPDPALSMPMSMSTRPACQAGLSCCCYC